MSPVVHAGGSDRVGSRSPRFRRAKVVTAALVAAALIPVGLVAPSALADAGGVTDTSFFGVWNGSSWSTDSLLDYSAPGMGDVEAAVKTGDLAAAKAALLQHMRTRTGHGMPNDPPSGSSMAADLSGDNILTGSAGEFPVGIATFTPTAGWTNTDVLTGVQTGYDQGRSVGFMLLGRDKSSAVASIGSRESSTQPKLVLTLPDGSQKTLTPSADTYIRAGADADVSYGTSTDIEVKEDGTPVTSEERRGYIGFDLSTITASPTAAQLELNGSTNGTTNQDVIVYKSSVVPESTTWNSTLGTTYSWQGEPGGVPWNTLDAKWTASQGADAEYVFSIARFPTFDQLSSRFAQNGDLQAAASVVAQTKHFLDVQPAAIFPRSLDTAIRDWNWLIAWDRIWGASSVDPDTSTSFLESLWSNANALASPSNYHGAINWGTFESRAVYSIAAYLPEFKKSSDWMTLAKDRLNGQLQSLVLPDGSYAEASSLYSIGEVSTLLAIYKIEHLNGGPAWPELDSSVLSLARYGADLTQPNGIDPQIGDSDAVSNLGALSDAGQQLNVGDVIYVGSGGAQGTKPTHDSILYPSQKLAVMRTGWDANALQAILLDNSGNHEHPDLLSTSLAGYGGNLLVNPGRYSYSKTDPIAQWLRTSTIANNTVEVDGKAQTLLAGAPGGRQINDWATNSAFDLVDAQQQANPGVTHQRTVLMLKGGLILVSDTMTPTDGGAHSYRQAWHPYAGSSVSVNGLQTTATGPDRSLEITAAPHTGVTAKSDSGYYSPRNSVVLPTTYSTYDVSQTSAGVGLDAVIRTTAGALGTGRTQVSDVPVSGNPSATTARAEAITLPDSNRTAIYYLRPAASDTDTYPSATFGSTAFDGRVLYLEHTGVGNPAHLAISGGANVVEHGVDLLTSPTAVRDVDVSWDAHTLSMDGARLVPSTDPASAIGVRAPGVKEVKLNGVSVPFTRVGNMVYAAATAVPQAPTLTSATAQPSAVQLDWLPTFGVTQYVIHYHPAGTSTDTTVDVPAGQTEVSVNALSVGTGYQFCVAAVNAAGEGPCSATLIATPVEQPPISLVATEDASVRDGSFAGVNYGSASALEVKNAGAPDTGTGRQAYLKFDLSKIDGPISSATVHLVPTSVGTAAGIKNGLSVVADDSWTESGITWANKPATGAPVATWSLTPAQVGSDISVDVTQAVRDQAAGDGVLSLAITSPVYVGGGGFVSYGSAQNGNTAYRPVLVVKH